jgi:hypothetical protein
VEFQIFREILCCFPSSALRNFPQPSQIANHCNQRSFYAIPFFSTIQYHQLPQSPYPTFSFSISIFKIEYQHKRIAELEEIMINCRTRENKCNRQFADISRMSDDTWHSVKQAVDAHFMNINNRKLEMYSMRTPKEAS